MPRPSSPGSRLSPLAFLLVGIVAGAALLALVQGSGSKAGPAAPPATAANPLGLHKVVGLSHVIDPKIPLWPGDPKVIFKPVATFAKDGYYLRKFTIGEHSATHMNAPNSFHVGGVGINHYGPTELIKPAVVIDVRKQAGENPDYALTRQDLATWEQQYGEVPAGSVVLLDTGWSRYWHNPQRFFGFDKRGGLHFPGFDGKTTHFLLHQRHIAGVGIDTHGVDPGQDETYATNTQVLAKPRIALENLTNLDKLPPTGSVIVIGALALRNGSGSPATVFGLVP